MARRRLLLLGGTAEAYRLARELEHDPRVDCLSSLAGRTADPALPAGRYRIGGFGGVAGLVDFLRQEGIDRVLDATHPFAAQMARHAAEACAALTIPRAKLWRPAWVPTPGDRWLPVPSIPAAADFLRTHPAKRIFMTLGRKELAPFIDMTDKWFLTRTVDPPPALPPGQLILARGPFQPEAEKRLMQANGIDLLVTKNSGGAAAKLAAAAELHIPVLMVERPAPPEGPLLAAISDALAWARGA